MKLHLQAVSTSVPAFVHTSKRNRRFSEQFMTSAPWRDSFPFLDGDLCLVHTASKELSLTRTLTFWQVYDLHLVHTTVNWFFYQGYDFYMIKMDQIKYTIIPIPEVNCKEILDPITSIVYHRIQKQIVQNNNHNITQF